MTFTNTSDALLEILTSADVSHPQMRLMTITPDEARQLLTLNKHNRKPRVKDVRSYSRDMKTGNWRLTGDTLKFSKNGLLSDGQHRLLGCIEANTPFQTYVVFGVDDDVQAYVDKNVKRTLGDTLKLNGWENVNRAGAVGMMAYKWLQFDGPVRNIRGAVTVGITEVLQFMEGNRALVMEATHSPDGAKYLPIRPSAWGAVYFRLKHMGVAQQTIDNFFDAVKTGANLSEGDPRLTLRNWFNSTGRNSKEADQHILAITKAWNAFARGESMYRLAMAGQDIPIPVMPV